MIAQGASGSHNTLIYPAEERAAEKASEEPSSEHQSQETDSAELLQMHLATPKVQITDTVINIPRPQTAYPTGDFTCPITFEPLNNQSNAPVIWIANPRVREPSEGFWQDLGGTCHYPIREDAFLTMYKTNPRDPFNRDPLSRKTIVQRTEPGQWEHP